MCAFRCLASLLLLLLLVVKAARPRLELVSQEAFVAQRDPCKNFRGRKKGTRCLCKGRFVTNSHCQKPLAEAFDLTEIRNGLCRCEDPCEQFHAKKEGSWCQCHEGLATNNHCEKPLTKSFSLSDASECRCDQTDPCEDFGAEPHGTDSLTAKVLCRCVFREVASLECSRPGQEFFSAEGNAAGCGCQDPDDYAKSIKSPVETAALAFCEAAARKGSKHNVPPLSVCEEQLSNRRAAGAYGRLDALLRKAPKTAAWHLTRVCHDECQELVNKTKEKMHVIQRDMSHRAIPISETCAARVVKKVEAEIFGCCGRSCGWNGRSCISWPFFDEQQKADWQAECCTEYNVLKNSSREEMCNSVLSTHDADLASKNDLSQEGKDVAGAYLGQDLQLLWTQKGVDSEMGRNYTWLQPKPEAGKEVTEQLLQLQPNVRKKALDEGWFEERELERASFMQIWQTGGSCDPEEMKRCTDDMKQWRTSVCAKQEGWRHTRMGKSFECKEMQATKNRKMARSPQECFDADYGVGTEAIRYYVFHYNKGNREQPISCYAETEERSCTLKEKRSLLTEATEFDRIWFWINAKSAAKTAPALA